MTTRDAAPLGAACWTDLWTSDVDGSRAFYSQLFDWQAEDPSPEFGGYFMFTRQGVPVAGGMGDMGDTADCGPTTPGRSTSTPTTSPAPWLTPEPEGRTS